MKKLLFSFLTILAFSVVQSQTIEIDSLNQELKTANGTKKIDLINALMGHYICIQDSIALQYYKTTLELLESENYPKGTLIAMKNYGAMKYCSGDLDSAIYYFRKASRIGLKHSFHEETGQLLSRLGFYFQTSNEFDSSEYYLNKGLSYAIENGDSLTMGSTSIGLGTLYQQRGQIDTAINMYFSALKIAEKMDHKPLIITAKLNIGTFYYDHQPSKLKISDFIELLKITREIGDQQREISVLEWLGYLKADSTEYDNAIEYFNEGLTVNKTVKDQNSEILLLQGIAYVYNLSGDNEKAISTNNKIIKLALSSGYELYLPSLYTNNVSNYLALEKYSDVIKNGLLAKMVSEKSGQIELYYKVLQDLAVAYSKLGMDSKAYEAQLEYTQLNKKIFDAEKSRQLTEMEAKYETEKKDLTISSLSQQASIKDLEIKQKNQGILIGLITVLLIAGIIYFIYRQRAFKNRQSQTELEQRFLRSQLNPHFISNALMAVQNFMLKNESEKASTYLAKFSKLMREILENSRQEFIPVEDEIQMLTNYLDIHRLRMNESFDYKIEIDESVDVETDTIPPMFVQPFIENAIEHGIINAKDHGMINLNLIKEGDYISIEIRDNGGGMDQDSAKSVEHKSLSTTIIQERMALFNKSLKKKIQLVWEDIRNENGEINGTKVELKVPFSYL